MVVSSSDCKEKYESGTCRIRIMSFFSGNKIFILRNSKIFQLP